MITKLLDPVNRLYRHRVAGVVAARLKNTPVTPNQLTLAHTLVGIFAAILIYFSHYILAVACFEIRTILDSADGILARLKNQSSPLGRILDTIGDGISFNALMIAGAMRIIQDFPTYQPSLILIIVFCFALTAAHCGVIYQLMKRKITSILLKEVDTVETEWREHWMKVHSAHPGLLDRFGLWLDSFTIRFISEEWYEKLQRRLHRNDWSERALNDAVMMNELARTTRRRELRNAVRFTSFLSDDNIFAIMSIIFLVLGFFPVQIFPYVHPVLIAFCAGFIYAVFSLLLALHYFHDFYHGVYRE
ncbi:MAG: CDP-alcohol phosphatidyltransferase family protein [Bdellovibrionales bacterium]|nr:CDP-alcohol phosphatidyltransferase family protein [Oligoflexia bacterium]